MNIPQHIIDSGARALFERDCKDHLNLQVFNGPPPAWEALHPNLQRSYKKRASAVIRATSKRVWDSGYAACEDDVHTLRNDWPAYRTPNPYRSVNE